MKNKALVYTLGGIVFLLLAHLSRHEARWSDSDS